MITRVFLIAGVTFVCSFLGCRSDNESGNLGNKTEVTILADGRLAVNGTQIERQSLLQAVRQAGTRKGDVILIGVRKMDTHADDMASIRTELEAAGYKTWITLLPPVLDEKRSGDVENKTP